MKIKLAGIFRRHWRYIDKKDFLEHSRLSVQIRYQDSKYTITFTNNNGIAKTIRTGENPLKADQLARKFLEDFLNLG